MVMNYIEASRGAQRFSFKSQKEPLKSSEALALRPFTSKEKRTLKKAGYLIHQFTHQTIKTQREMGKLIKCFGSTASEVETVASMVGEVAFNPRHIFFLGSNHRSFNEQEAMIEGSGIALRETFGLPNHIRTIIGSAPDYAQLAFFLLEEMGSQSFREKYRLRLIRTNTPVENSHAAVGFFTLAQGVPIYKCDDSVRLSNLFVAPLVVSIKK